MLINGVDLLGDLALLEEDGGLVLLGGKDDSFLGDNPWVIRLIPMEEPVLLMASTAYSICCSLPSGVKVVVLWSYLRDI